MRKRIRPVEAMPSEGASNAPFYGSAKKILFSVLKKLEWGQIHILEGDLRMNFGQRTDEAPLEVSVTVLHPSFYNRILLGGSVGSGEAYMMGLWSADDLTALIRIILRNEAVFEGLDRRWSRLSAPAYRVFHALRRDTRKGSR
jgi:cyclopropane-fatty-acyl-phospholipid synthase